MSELDDLLGEDDYGLQALNGLRKLGNFVRKLQARIDTLQAAGEAKEELLKAIDEEVSGLNLTIARISGLLEGNKTVVNVDANTNIKGDVHGDAAGGDITK